MLNMLYDLHPSAGRTLERVKKKEKENSPLPPCHHVVYPHRAGPSFQQGTPVCTMRRPVPENRF